MIPGIINEILAGKPAQLWSISPDATVFEAIEIMANKNIGALPVILAKKTFKSYYEKLGPPRYYVGVFLFLMMMALPVKMLLRWLINLKYIVGIPEIFFNI